MMSELAELEPLVLCASPFNKRRWRADDSQDEKLVALAENIAKHGGNFEPIIVRPVDGRETRYEIVAGECRWRAVRLLWSHKMFKKAAKPRLLSIVRVLTDAEAFAITMDENRRRQNLSPLEEADTLAAYMEANPGWGVAEAAAQLGVSRSLAARRLQLRKLSARWQAVMVEGGHPASGWPAGHFERVATLSQSAQDELLEQLYDVDANDEWQAAEVRSMTFDQLRRMMARHFRVLREVPWVLEDESLPGGACSKCLKRSSCQPDLFEQNELDDQGRDTCLDAACFVAKQDAQLLRVRAELQAEHGNLVIAQRGQSGARGTVFEAEKPVSVWQMQAARKTERGAVPVLVVGEGATGEVIWMKPMAGARTGERKPEPLEARRAKLESARLRWVAKLFSEWLNDHLSGPDEELPTLVDHGQVGKLALVCEVGGGVSWPTARWAGRAMERADAAGAAGLDVMVNHLLRVALSSLRNLYESLSMPQSSVSREPLQAFARAFGLDWQDFWDAAERKHPTPASWAALDENGERKGVNAFTKAPVKKRAKSTKVKA